MTPAQWEWTHHVLRAVFGVPDYYRITPPSYARCTHRVTGAPMVTLQYGDIGKGSRTGDILETCGVGFGDSDAAARRDAFDRVRDGIVDHFAQRWAWALEDDEHAAADRLWTRALAAIGDLDAILSESAESEGPQ
jgi:hypothetical protein